MATQTTIVKGIYWDGCTETDTTSVAKKINDVTTAATTIHSVTIMRKGRELVAVIVYA